MRGNTPLTRILAVLMIAGLLWYLRDGRKALLCLSLFLAPLLQYGLVLFGVALMSAATVLPPSRPRQRQKGIYARSGFRHWFQRRIALVWPAGCFLAGCAISYAVTLRYQWQEGGFASKSYLQKNYYQGKFEAHSIFEFSIDGTWGLLTYHLPWVVATAALVAFALLLVAAFLGKFQGEFPGSAIVALFTLCIAVSVGATLLGIYPLGGIRQVIYLGPIVFLAVGVALHRTVDSLATLTHREWLVPALTVVYAGAIALAGVDAMRQDSLYGTSQNLKSVLAALEERVREEDVVYVVRWAGPSIQFYHGEEGSPDNYYYGTRWCGASAEPGLRLCLREMVDLVVSFPNVPDRTFLVYDKISIPEELELLGWQVSVERVPADDGKFSIALIGNIKASGELAARPAYEMLVSGEPVIRSDFDVYLSENTLGYVKDPCSPADTKAMFFLHLYPVDVNDLPDHRRGHGFNNLDFNFYRRGVILDGRCMATVALPEYDIARISTGQSVPVAGGFNHPWEAEFLFNAAVMRKIGSP